MIEKYQFPLIITAFYRTHYRTLKKFVKVHLYRPENAIENLLIIYPQRYENYL